MYFYRETLNKYRWMCEARKRILCYTLGRYGNERKQNCEPLCVEMKYYCDAMKIPKHMLAMTAIFKLNGDSIEQTNDTLWDSQARTHTYSQAVVRVLCGTRASYRHVSVHSRCIVQYGDCTFTVCTLWMNTRFSLCFSFSPFRHSMRFALSLSLYAILNYVFGLTFSWVIS